MKLLSNLKERSVKRMTEKLSKIPYYSEEYEKILKKIQRKERKTYGNQYILCLNSEKLRNSGITTTDIYPHINSEKIFLEICDNLLINEMTNNNISGYFPRYKIEYDYRFKQVLTFCYITSISNDMYVFLRKKENRKIALVGGHVDYDLSVFNTSPNYYLVNNLIKEILEEIKIIDKRTNIQLSTKELLLSQATIEPKIFVNEDETDYSLRNVAFIYKVELNTEKLLDSYMFYSNEEKEHDVEIMTLEQLQLNPENSGQNFMVQFVPKIVLRSILSNSYQT